MAAPVATKTELVQEIAETLDGEVSNKTIKEVLEAFTDAVYDQLAQGRRVRLPGLVTFQYRVARKKAIKKGTMVRNPSTGEEFPHAGRKASASVVAKAVVPKPLNDHVGNNLSVARATKLTAPAKKTPAKNAGRKNTGRKRGRR